MSDKAGYDEYYKGKTPHYAGDESFERNNLQAFCKGGSNPRGYARGLAVQMLLASAKPGDTVLDAGSGLGNLSIFLANKGLNVIGVEISEEGSAAAQYMSRRDRRKLQISGGELRESVDATGDGTPGIGIVGAWTTDAAITS